MLDQAGLDAHRKLLDEITELHGHRKEIVKMSDDSLLAVALELDSGWFDTEHKELLLEVTAAYRRSVAQIIDKELRIRSIKLSQINIIKDGENEDF